MRVAIIYHSLSGNTRRVAALLAARLAGTAEADLVEVHDQRQYSTLTAYASGAPRAMRGEVAEIEPAEIDVAGYDVIVLGTPVWALAPTPAARGAVAALRNAEGKEAAVYATSGGGPSPAAEALATALAARGVRVRGTVQFERKHLDDEAPMNALVELVTRPPSAG
ncbi:MAG: NAD(P)H-dependent oxidoreductase [Methanospirillum sp.]